VSGEAIAADPPTNFGVDPARATVPPVPEPSLPALVGLALLCLVSSVRGLRHAVRATCLLGVLLMSFGLVPAAANWALAAEPSAGSSAGTDAFMKNRMKREGTRVPRKALAFYYTWYGTPDLHGRWIHWDGVQPEKRAIKTSTNHAKWAKIIPRVEARYPREFLLIADGYKEDYARVFDGVHTYNICGWVRGKSVEELRTASAASFRDAVALAKKHARIACVTVIPGYDDTKIRKPGLQAGRLGGQTYDVLWEEAIRADPDWVLITSWNEWHEGSEIEPSWEDGDTYLKRTGVHTRKFKGTP
jgi:hypothetical protein